MVFYKGHTYQLVETTLTFAQARAAAEAAGGHLAIVTSQAENDVIFDLASASDDLGRSTAPDGGNGRYVWLGGTDAAVEQDWRWLDGTRVRDGFDAWGSGPRGTEPDDYGVEQDGLAMGLSRWPYPSGGIGEPGEWNDVSITNRLFYVIEYDGLFGGASADTIKGGGIDDLIQGRGGADRLTGGKGADTFQFLATTDSGPGRKADLITDFRPGEDIIDLTAIDARTASSREDAFRFLGEDAGGSKARDLWIDTRGGFTYVYGETTGDGRVDFTLKLVGELDLSRADFLL